MQDKTLIQEQFGKNAQAYAESKVHKLGASLARLVELVAPQADWRVLDVATAVGHTAFAFAPHVAHVFATDITAEMLALAKKETAVRKLSNVTVEFADAESLPYANAAFDLVTCRIAPHHFGDLAQFLSEAARVLRPGGTLAIVDNVVPGGYAGDYVNAFEKLRDPSHGRCLTLTEWREAFVTAGLTVTHRETLDKQMDFGFWAKRHDAVMQRYLRAMLLHAPEAARAFLRPQQTAKGITFRLREGIIIGRKD
ncbi:MAG: class I SAM-dependent methyltransferase [Ardenticatenaceae bacterium]|nr:class I SAM-dependent methyltransferase [Ardenticatenaceae bacterium]MCB8991029.1 class I SAM-dependent methyltransferase [Ardenticatenaceae bacterium]